jgi:ABC-type xylose transport system permease subunit
MSSNTAQAPAAVTAPSGGGSTPSGEQRGLRGLRERLTSGELGSLPVIIGLAVTWIVFYLLNANFLSSRNLGNLLLDSAAIGTISIGIVLVLLLGEIDLSVGSVAGVSAAVFTVGFVSHGWPIGLAMIASLLVGAVIGSFYGMLYTRFGVPSFVITLAGLLGFLGLQLRVLGAQGSINIPFDSWLVTFCQQWYLPPTASYVLVVAVAAISFVMGVQGARRRASAGLSSTAVTTLAVRSVLVAVALGAAVWYLNRYRGVGYMFLLFVVLVVVMGFLLRRTRWGRAVYAVGGNVEAARRAGIRVNRIYLSVFALASTFAALGGLLLAGRLAAANQSTGGADTNLNAIAAAVIGGTSLFGGRGSAYSALLGILVIQSISSGLTLLSLDASVRFMVTGAVLLLAVIVDSASRRSRTASGRA